MPYPPWYEDAVADLRRLTNPPHPSHPRATPEARAAALTFCREQAGDTPKPAVLLTASGGVQVVWTTPAVQVAVVYDADGAPSHVGWDRFGPAADRAPYWARGVLARALHRVR